MLLSKKGDLELRYIILLVLGIIVLIALTLVFREQVMHFVRILDKVFIGIDETPAIKDIIGKN
ncbi:MAG: hypothetical protein AABW64_01750 [Nanoarchaeota archaeon]